MDVIFSKSQRAQVVIIAIVHLSASVKTLTQEQVLAFKGCKFNASTFAFFFKGFLECSLPSGGNGVCCPTVTPSSLTAKRQG